MKNTVAIICLILNFTTGYAQNSLKEKDFINQVVTERNIIYSDSVSNSAISYFDLKLKYTPGKTFRRVSKDSVDYIDSTGKKIRILKSKTSSHITVNKQKGLMSGRFIPIGIDSITLTDDEIANMIQKFEEGSKQRWDKNLIVEARQISADTINAVFEDRMWGWEKMRKKGVHAIFTFGTPVFIRNDQYCIFYSDNSCGYLCGSGKLAIYKKEAGKWTFWGDIITWIS